jgi:hypothetical protein
MDGWSLHIEKVSNGYIARFVDQYEDGSGKFIRTVVFEGPEEANGGLIAMRNLLLYVKDHFGVFYNKHDKQNIIIDIEGTTNDEIH